jgi:PAS domain S-box-containing protein
MDLHGSLSAGRNLKNRRRSRKAAANRLKPRVKERASQQTEEALRLTQFSLDHAGDAIFLLGSDASFVYVNEKACRSLGYSRSELLSMKVYEIDTEGSKVPWEQRWRNIKERGSATIESTHRAKDGREIPVEITAYYVEFENRELVCAIARDITERKRIEEALREDEDRFRHISSAISDIAYSCVKLPDGSYSIDWMMGPLERVTGYSVEEIKAQGCWRFLVVDEDLALFDERVTGLAPSSTGFCELRLRHKSGNAVWVESSAECVIKPGNSERLRLYGRLVDITQRSRRSRHCGRARKSIENCLRRQLTASHWPTRTPVSCLTATKRWQLWSAEIGQS